MECASTGELACGVARCHSTLAMLLAYRGAGCSPHTGLQGLAGLAALQRLTLDLANCEQLANVDGLQSVAGLAAIRPRFEDTYSAIRGYESPHFIPSGFLLDLEGCSKLRSPMQRQFHSKDELLAELGCGGKARTLRVKVRLKRRSAKRKSAKSCAIQ